MVVEDEVTELLSFISPDKYTVAFTGAGISTASGLPDYRGPNGLFTKKQKGLSPKRLKKPWYRHDPNPGHYALVELMKKEVLNFIISQNVDGLHLKSGISESRIAELHGNSSIMKCSYCKSRYHIDEIGWDFYTHGKGRADEPPHPDQPVCYNCGGRIIATVVDFGDPLPQTELKVAKSESIRADLFLVLGSSLKVNPASSLPRLAKSKGAELIIINQGSTKRDNLADLKIDADLSILLPSLLQYLQ